MRFRPKRIINLNIVAGVAVVTLVAQEAGKNPSSYMPVDIQESFASIMSRMSAAKAGIMERQKSLLEERYDLSNRPASGVTMSRGKPVQEGVRVKLASGLRYRSVVFPLLTTLPPILLVAWSLTRILPQFWKPCFEWGLSQSVSRRIAPEAPCRVIEGTSETRLQAVVKLLLVHGGILIAGVFGILGALLAKPFLSVLGAGLIFLESIPLIFSFAFLTVFVSGLFLLAARSIAPVQGAAKAGTRLMGSLGAVAVLVCLPALFKGPPAFFVFLLIALVFVAIVGWWPARTRGSESHPSDR
jgi:hypothetical protein